jgi:hypothetical protein
MMVNRIGVHVSYNFVAQEPTLIVITSGNFTITDGNYVLLFSCHLLNIAHESCGQWPEVHAITRFLNSTNAPYVVLAKNSGNLNRVPEPAVVCPSATTCG